MAGGKSQPKAMITKLLVTVVGVLLIIAPPFVFSLVNLVPRFQPPVIAGVEFASLVVGFVLVYLALKETAPSTKL